MFDNNGPVAAQATMQTYIATEGLGAFPADVRDRFQALNTMPLFQALTEGTETLYAALREDIAIPNRPAALNALGAVATAACSAQLASEGPRWWGMVQWAANEITPAPEGEPLPEPPEVKASFSFLPPEPVEPPLP